MITKFRIKRLFPSAFPSDALWTSTDKKWWRKIWPRLFFGSRTTKAMRKTFLNILTEWSSKNVWQTQNGARKFESHSFTAESPNLVLTTRSTLFWNEWISFSRKYEMKLRDTKIWAHKTGSANKRLKVMINYFDPQFIIVQNKIQLVCYSDFL